MQPQLKTKARRLGGVVAMLLAMSPAVVVAAPSAEAYAPSSTVTARYEARILYLVNAQRARYGRGKLALSSCPERYAESWTAYLARTGRFYHRNMWTYLSACGASRVAENIARGNVSADRLVVAWMASPGHRKNILNGQLTRIGVGAVYARGSWTVTTDFSRP